MSEWRIVTLYLVQVNSNSAETTISIKLHIYNFFNLVMWENRKLIQVEMYEDLLDDWLDRALLNDLFNVLFDLLENFVSVTPTISSTGSRYLFILHVQSNINTKLHRLRMCPEYMSKNIWFLPVSGSTNVFLIIN